MYACILKFIVRTAEFTRAMRRTYVCTCTNIRVAITYSRGVQLNVYIRRCRGRGLIFGTRDRNGEGEDVGRNKVGGKLFFERRIHSVRAMNIRKGNECRGSFIKWTSLLTRPSLCYFITSQKLARRFVRSLIKSDDSLHDQVECGSIYGSFMICVRDRAAKWRTIKLCKIFMAATLRDAQRFLDILEMCVYFVS